MSTKTDLFARLDSDGRLYFDHADQRIHILLDGPVDRHVTMLAHPFSCDVALPRDMSAILFEALGPLAQPAQEADRLRRLIHDVCDSLHAPDLTPEEAIDHVARLRAGAGVAPASEDETL